MQQNERRVSCLCCCVKPLRHAAGAVVLPSAQPSPSPTITRAIGPTTTILWRDMLCLYVIITVPTAEDESRVRTQATEAADGSPTSLVHPSFAAV
jgi:hypothetical protein